MSSEENLLDILQHLQEAVEPFEKDPVLKGSTKAILNSTKQLSRDLREARIDLESAQHRVGILERGVRFYLKAVVENELPKFPEDSDVQKVLRQIQMARLGSFRGKLAVFVQAMEHATKEERATYLKEHPNAKPENHSVGPKKEGPSKKKELSGDDIDKASDKAGDILANASKEILKDAPKTLRDAAKKHGATYANAALDPDYLETKVAESKKLMGRLDAKRETLAEDQRQALDTAMKDLESAFRGAIRKVPDIREHASKANVDRAAKAYAIRAAAEAFGIRP